MHWLLDFLHELKDPRLLVQAGGYIGLTAIILPKPACFLASSFLATHCW